MQDWGGGVAELWGGLADPWRGLVHGGGGRLKIAQCQETGRTSAAPRLGPAAGFSQAQSCTVNCTEVQLNQPC